MDLKPNKELLDLLLEQSQKSYEDIEISGMPEHNARVREKQKNNAIHEEGNLTRQELASINKSLQAQIDEASKKMLSAKKQSRYATILSIIGIVVPSLISLAALIVSIVK